MVCGKLLDIYSCNIDTLSLLTMSCINTMSICLEDNSDILLLAGGEIKLNFIVFSPSYFCL